jgi:transporter family-2 protein
MGALIVLALIAGAFMPIQAGLNAQLARYLGHPLLAALASFLVGFVGLLCLCLLSGLRWPNSAQLTEGPPWLWLGGLLGAFFIAVMVIAAPRLGAATSISLVIAGQMLTSLAIDHYGLIGFPSQVITPLRVVGMLLVIGGVCLIRLF